MHTFTMAGRHGRVYPVDEVIRLFDRPGIRRVLVSSTPDEGTWRLFDAAPDRVVPMLRLYHETGDSSRWSRDTSLISYMEKELASRPWRGIGEVHLEAGDEDAPVVRRAVELAARRGLIVQVHTGEAGMEALLKRYPDARFLWAHAGLGASVASVRRLVQRYPDLRVELSLRYDVAPERPPGPGMAEAVPGFFRAFPRGDRYLGRLPLGVRGGDRGVQPPLAWTTASRGGRTDSLAQRGATLPRHPVGACRTAVHSSPYWTSCPAAARSAQRPGGDARQERGAEGRLFPVPWARSVSFRAVIRRRARSAGFSRIPFPGTRHGGDARAASAGTRS